MEYLIRFVQVHETFRKAETEALASVAGIDLEFLHYIEDSPFAIVRLPSEAAARTLMSRSILSHAIYELWATAPTYPALHSSIQTRTSALWPLYATTSFRFTLDGYRGKRSLATQRALIESFSYLPFNGEIVMNDAKESFVVFEDYDFRAPEPKRLYFGRFIAKSGRDAVTKFDLKKRRYISTTSMDAELALVTANLALAAPGKVLYDPFVGTGSFIVSAAHFGAVVMGSDIDGRSVRGRKDRNLLSNFEQYGLTDRFFDCFVSDMTQTPLRTGRARWLDGILCDPPYGVREGLKVLGQKDGGGRTEVLVNGKPAYLQEGYVPPKKPYSFEAMLDDILEFSSATLVDNARLCLWMPTANDEDLELDIPKHPYMELVSVCIQSFHKYVDVDPSLPRGNRGYKPGLHADELNSFRKKYFEGFRSPPDGDSAPSKSSLQLRPATPEQQHLHLSGTQNFCRTS